MPGDIDVLEGVLLPLTQVGAGFDQMNLDRGSKGRQELGGEMLEAAELDGAGAVAIRSKKAAWSRSAWVNTAAAAVSSPITPRGASSNGTSCSWSAWGA